MDIVGLKTKTQFDLTTLITTDILLEDSITILSSNCIELSADLGTTVSKTITLATLDATTLGDYSYTLITAEPLPISIEVLELSTDSDCITVTYTPTINQRTTCIIRLSFATGLVRNIYVQVLGTINPAEFSINPTNLEFGDIGIATSSVLPLTITTASDINKDLLEFGFYSTNFIEMLNFNAKIVSVASGVYTADITYVPRYSISSEVVLTIYYDQTAIGSVIISGSKANLVPVNFTQIDLDSPLANLNPQVILASYTNSTTKSCRVDSIALANNTLGEFAVANLSTVIDSIIPQGATFVIPLDYVPKQGNYIAPKLVINGTYF